LHQRTDRLPLRIRRQENHDSEPKTIKKIREVGIPAKLNASSGGIAERHSGMIPNTIGA